MTIEKSLFGGYYVGGDFRVWDGNPSEPLVRLKLVTTTGIGENGLAQPKIDISPNPANGVVTVKSELPIEGIRLFDVLGKAQSIRFYPPTDKEHNLKIEKLPAGIYFVQVLLKNGQSLSRKLVKD